MTAKRLRRPAPSLRVLAAILEKRGRLLIARRKGGDRFAGLWEFPGGKQEPGELPEECLRRELLEEFGVKTRVDDFLCAISYDSPALSLKLLAYRVKHLSGTFSLCDHDEIRWATPAEIISLPLTEPDRLLIARLKELGALEES
ncbi:MAG: (deoxy)nucleoside triphosphate pyrophosphohydrolase [Acidobacteriota bacterium]